MKLAISFLTLGLLLVVSQARIYQHAEIEKKKCKKPAVTPRTAKEIQKKMAPGLINRIKDIADHPERQQDIFWNTEKCLPVITGTYYEYYLNPDLQPQDKKRIVCVDGATKWYYSNDHYNSFYSLNDMKSLRCP